MPRTCTAKLSVTRGLHLVVFCSSGSWIVTNVLMPGTNDGCFCSSKVVLVSWHVSQILGSHPDLLGNSFDGALVLVKVPLVHALGWQQDHRHNSGQLQRLDGTGRP